MIDPSGFVIEPSGFVFAAGALLHPVMTKAAANAKLPAKRIPSDVFMGKTNSFV
ncbi:MAG: hypothetical protein KGK08_04285 [Acidobacteriota bacterium]|nr:hypothetical protein [Acidobacteriota bacterium]